MNDFYYKEDRIMEIQNMFRRIINKTHNYPEKVNIFCNDENNQFILNYGDILSNQFPNISIHDIYIALIYIYYSLNLGEQTIDQLYLIDIKRYCDNFKDVEKLYFMISIGNDPIASSIRRYFFGMTPLIKDECKVLLTPLIIQSHTSTSSLSLSTSSSNSSLSSPFSFLQLDQDEVI